MPNIYVRSTDGSDTDDGSTWALAKATLAGAAAIDAAGDTIWLSSSHSETTAAAVTIDIAGTLGTPSRLLSCNDSAEPPTALATGATIATTTGNNGRNITIVGSFYAYGITVSPNAGGTAYSAAITLVNAATDAQIWENSTFNISPPSSSNSYLSLIGNGNGGDASRVELRNCTINVGGANNRVYLAGNNVLQGCTFTGTNTILFLPVSVTARSFNALIQNCDLSNMGTGDSLVSVSTMPAGLITIRNCKLASDVSVITGTFPVYGARVVLHNCDSGDTNYRLFEADRSGSVVHETTIVKSSGASDGTTALSWKAVTTANAVYPMYPFALPEIVKWNETTGSSITATVEIVHDSQGAGASGDFQNDEVWLEVSYSGTSDNPIGSLVSTAPTTILTAATDIENSSVTWTTTGLTTPVKQKLAVTFTPQNKGYICAKVYVAKASKTVYVDPLITIS